jgi:hypothetical protein
MSTRRLLMHHELLLLALHDQKGTVAFGKMQHFGLAGAVFAELLLSERVRIVTERRRRKDRPLVEVVDASRTGEAVLDAALSALAKTKRRAAPSHAVGRIARVKDLRHEVARELVRRGVVRASEDQVLLFFTRRVYPTLDPGPERALVARIRDALEGSPRSVETPTAIVIALAHATGILQALYSRKELKALAPRIETVMDEAGEGAHAAQEAVQAAIAAAVAATSAAMTAATAGG